MLRTILLALLVLNAASAGAETSAPGDAPDHVGFSIIRTASLSVRESLVFSGGSFSNKVQTNFSAILVKHDDSFFLFDSGLGRTVDRQYRQDMPMWQRPFFKYDDPVIAARDQIDKAGLPPIRKIILSHSHWDHASGIGDFPGAQVWVAEPERAFIRNGGTGVGKPWASQVGSKDIVWRTLSFKPLPYEGFDSSLDLFDDGSVVLVPLYGHTPGSVGMFVTVDSGQRYFFSGDVSWSLSALKQERPKFWAARHFVDDDAQQTAHTVTQIHQLMVRLPALTVVPAHDGAVQAALGYFPQWCK